MAEIRILAGVAATRLCQHIPPRWARHVCDIVAVGWFLVDRPEPGMAAAFDVGMRAIDPCRGQDEIRTVVDSACRYRGQRVADTIYLAAGGFTAGGVSFADAGGELAWPEDRGYVIFVPHLGPYWCLPFVLAMHFGLRLTTVALASSNQFFRTVQRVLPWDQRIDLDGIDVPSMVSSFQMLRAVQAGRHLLVTYDGPLTDLSLIASGATPQRVLSPPARLVRFLRERAHAGIRLATIRTVGSYNWEVAITDLDACQDAAAEIGRIVVQRVRQSPEQYSPMVRLGRAILESSHSGLAT